jgi:DNA-binding FadR family transcriptional regulator
MRILRTQNIVSIQRGIGTVVNPINEWSSLDAIIHNSSPETLATFSEQILRARQIVETGAVEIAARHRTSQDLTELTALMKQMQQASDSGDIDEFAATDLAFHTALMQATGNLFISIMFNAFGRSVIVETMRFTSANTDIRTSAMKDHAAILTAVTDKSPERARQAMTGHMDHVVERLRQLTNR